MYLEHADHISLVLDSAHAVPNYAKCRSFSRECSSCGKKPIGAAAEVELELFSILC